MAPEPTKKWAPILAIAAALAIWGIVLAIGAYKAPVGQSAGNDGGKLLVVAVTIGSFLLLWGAILGISASNIRRRAEQKSTTSDDPQDPPSE